MVVVKNYHHIFKTLEVMYIPFYGIIYFFENIDEMSIKNAVKSAALQAFYFTLVINLILIPNGFLL